MLKTNDIGAFAMPSADLVRRKVVVRAAAMHHQYSCHNWLAAWSWRAGSKTMVAGGVVAALEIVQWAK